MQDQQPIYFPPTALDFAAELYPMFTWALSQSNLDGPRFFVLSFLRRSSVVLDGQKARLHTEVTLALQQIGTAKGKIESTLRKLQRTKCAIRRDLDNRKERVEHFGSARGQNRALLLTPGGVRSLDSFNVHINEVSARLLALSANSPLYIKAILSHFEQNNELLLTAAQKLSAELHRSNIPRASKR